MLYSRCYNVLRHTHLFNLMKSVTRMYLFGLALIFGLDDSVTKLTVHV